NFYALWAAPLLAFTLPGAVSWIKNKGSWIKIICWLLGAAGLFLSMSRAGWLGLAAAVGVYALVAADKKIRRLIFAGGVVLALAAAAVPNLRYRVILPFYGEKSAVSRLSLWQTGWKGVAESPITGLGLTGFARQWPVLNTDPNIDTHNFPHNIFLDMWVELGLAGLIGFIGLIGYGLYRGLHKRHRPKIDTVLPDNLAGKQLAEAQALDFEEMQNQTFRFALALAIIAILFQGLVDNPYFKNDLALVFWMLYAFI
ncbi:MAG TPA: O-antigen ligase family protein, partial [Patescibacteria group bacterium]|nr:O-antigen ligase family protein [Patescibacteria group bacterium]